MTAQSVKLTSAKCLERMSLVLHAATPASALTSDDGFEMGGLQLFGLDGIV